MTRRPPTAMSPLEQNITIAELASRIAELERMRDELQDANSRLLERARTAELRLAELQTEGVTADGQGRT